MKHSVLIIDDEKAIRDVLFFALEDRYNVFSAGTPEEAELVLSEKTIDVILLDMKLGLHDGLNVLRHLKAAHPEIEVLVITAYGSIKSSVQAIREGALNYLTKPVDIEELVVFIDEEGAAAPDTAAGAVVLAPKGAQPGGLMAGTVQITATVTAIDQAQRTATLRFEDGSSRTFPVREDIDLSQRRVGETVVFQVTEMIAISIEKP